MSLLQYPGVDQYEIIKQYLHAIKIHNTDAILPKPPPPESQPPSPEDQMSQAQLQLVSMQTASIMMDRELKAFELDIEDKKVQGQIARWGTQGASDKMDSVANMAKVDGVLGEKSMDLAERQAQMIAPMGGQMPLPQDQISMQLAQFEQSIPGGGQQSPQGGQGQQAQMGMSGQQEGPGSQPQQAQAEEPAEAQSATPQAQAALQAGLQQAQKQ